MSTQAGVGTPKGDTKLLMLILAIGVQLALLGAYIGLKSTFGDDGGPAVASASQSTTGKCSLGCDVRTSFGSLVVGTAQTLPGVTSRNLGGMSHGIAGYVPPDKAQVQVTVELTNRLRVPVAYSPEQFTLVSKGTQVPVTTASIRPATLLPDAGMEATLIFVVPRKGQKLQLAFKETGRTAPYLVDLGRVDTAPKGKDDHSHQ